MENQNIKSSISKQPWFWVIVSLIMIIILLSAAIFSNKLTNQQADSETRRNTSGEQNQQNNPSENPAEETTSSSEQVQGSQSKQTVVKETSTPTDKQTISLPESNPVPAAPTQTTPTKIAGLASIRISGGIWENWDADTEKDGPFIEVVYLDSRGEIITSDEVKKLPISVDVELFTTDTSNYSYKKGRLVFSAHYSKEQIIFGDIYPKIRIPKEQISVNPDVDYPYGYLTITIHTPEQGNFSDESNFIVLYEK